MQAILPTNRRRIMKNQLNIPVAIIILVGVLTLGAQAQTANAQRVLANIPFTFSVGKTTLPAGRYTIAVLNPSSDRKILQIRSADGRASAVILTTGIQGNASDDAKLVFDRYGDRYFFAQAQMAGDATTLAAVKSRAERSAKHALATSKSRIVIVVAG
jgi:hypothetical protein